MAKGNAVPAQANHFLRTARGIVVRLWTPSRLCNNDLLWIAIPIATDNIGNDIVLRKH